MSSKSSKSSNGSSSDAAAAGISDASLDTVRDILFGAELRRTDNERGELEARLNASINSLQETMTAQLDQLRKDMETHRTQLEASLSEASATLVRDIGELSRRSEETDAETVARLDESVRSLNTQMEMWRDELATELSAAQQRLTDDKADRATIADLLVAMSDQLMRDPGSGKR